MTQTAHQTVLLVSGPSGAGRTTAIRALEDIGFEAIDNLPLSLLPRLIDSAEPGHRLAVGLDVRNRDFAVDRVVELANDLAMRDGIDSQLIYLDCAQDVLVRRYSETRRRHPLAEGDSPAQAIAREVDLLQTIRDRADVLIDTSALSVHDARAEVERLFAPKQGRFLSIQVQSFSYKRGLPRGLDLVFDVRFLRNPHWDQALRPKDGRDASVAAYVAEDALYQPFFDRVLDLVTMLLPAYKTEGKSYLTIGFGCTGGRHRSVALTEALGAALRDGGWAVGIRHREMDRVP